MKLAHYESNGKNRVGLVEGDLIFDIEPAAKKLGVHNQPLTIDSLLAEGLLGTLRQATKEITTGGPGVRLESVRLLSPVLNPEKMLLLAVNYASHSKEGDIRLPTEPYLFTKFRNSLIGPGDPVLIPRMSNRVDWEAELAVIIGKTGKYIARQDAMEYVAGFAVANDISFRDFQFAPRMPDGKTTLGLNWVKGKGLDSSFPLGPWLVTTDEIEDPYRLEISLSVNGQVKQKSTTAQMVFKIDTIIEYVSAGITLRPGDIISTGTPEGVAEFTGQPFLKDGDTLEAKVEGIGALRNPVKAE